MRSAMTIHKDGDANMFVGVMYIPAALRHADNFRDRVSSYLVGSRSGWWLNRRSYGALALKPTVLSRSCFEMGWDGGRTRSGGKEGSPLLASVCIHYRC